MKKFEDRFSSFTKYVAEIFGSVFATLSAFIIILIWIVGGFIVGFTTDYQIYVNTGTTIITFLLGFLILNTENRSSRAEQLKLDELIHAISTANNKFLKLEEQPSATVKDRNEEINKEVKKENM